MYQDQIAKAEITTNASIEKVWDALVNPAAIKQYMFGTNAVSSWLAGSSIVWKGDWKGVSYEDKGLILQFIPGRLLQYSHFSPLSGFPDTPDNYHTVTITLSTEKSLTRVALTQDNNPTDLDREHSEQNWEMMLAGLKNFLEK